MVFLARNHVCFPEFFVGVTDVVQATGSAKCPHRSVQCETPSAAGAVVPHIIVLLLKRHARNGPQPVEPLGKDGSVMHLCRILQEPASEEAMEMSCCAETHLRRSWWP